MNLAIRSGKPVAVMTAALEHAARALSAFLGDRVLKSTNSSIKTYALAELPTLYGPEEMPVACAAFEVDGGDRGLLLLLLPLDQAGDVLDTLLGDFGSPDDEELADSVFGELGNVVGSSFLNYVADSMQIRMTMSPPVVSRDMVGALLATVAGASAAWAGSEVPVVHTELTDGSRAELSVYLLWVPGRRKFNGWGDGD